MTWIKRILVTLAIALTALAMSFPFLLRRVGGDFDHVPDAARLSPDAQKLIDRAFADVDPQKLRDYHVHIVGRGTDGVHTWANPKLFEGWHPIHRLKGAVYMSAAGVRDQDHADLEFRQRLLRLIDLGPKGARYHALAFDHHYRPDGSRDLGHSEFYTSTADVVRLAKQRPDVLVPVASVHPYRKDGLTALARWAKEGVRFIKWLPNAQGMDAADDRLDEFYHAMKQHNMVLLTHTGEEQAVEAEAAQALGNPLKFRRALDIGVKVIMAHAASLGKDTDQNGERHSSFSLFLELMQEPRYRGLLFGELSAITQINRLPEPLTELLKQDQLHDRLVNGSDYPLPAINVLISTRALVYYGFITDDERELLNEVYQFNPLLFDYVVKRTIRLPGTERRFPPRVFMAHPELE